MRSTSVISLMVLPLLLLSSHSLAAYPRSNSLTTWEQIHQTLHAYPLAIDLKKPYLFNLVFAPDAFANYTGYVRETPSRNNRDHSPLHSYIYILMLNLPQSSPTSPRSQS